MNPPFPSNNMSSPPVDEPEKHVLIQQELEVRTRELAETVAVLNATLNSMSEGLMAVDLDDHVTFINQRAIELLQLPPEVVAIKKRSAIKAHVAQLTPDPASFLNKFDEIIKSPHFEARDTFELKDGRSIERWVRPQRRNGVLAGAVVTFRDVTALSRSKAETALLLQESEQSRQVLLSIVEDQQIAKNEMRKSNQRFLDLVDTTDGIVWEADATTFTFTYVSKNAERLLGYPVNEWLKPDFWANHLHREDRETAIKFCQYSTEQMEHHEFEYRFMAQDGRTVWLRDIAKVIAENGKPRWLRGLMIDITAYKASQEKLRLNEARLALATVAGGVGIWGWDIVQNRLDWDDQMYRLYGITPDTFGGAYDSWRKGVHPEDRVRCDQDIQQALNGEKGFNSEFRVVWPDGSIHHIRGLGQIRRDTAGQPVYMLGTNWDITEQKRNEEQLKLSEQTARASHELLLEAQRIAHMGNWTWDAVKNSVWWSDELCRLYGKDPQAPEHSYEDDQNHYTPESAAQLTQTVNKTMQTGEPFEIDLELSRKDRSVQWVHSRGEAVRNEHGKIVGLRGTVQDITTQKLAEGALKESEERFRTLFESAADAIITLDERGHVLNMNHAAQALLGYQAQEIVGNKMEQILPPEHRQIHPEYMQNYIKTGIKKIIGIGREVEAIRKDGLMVPVHLNISEARIGSQRIFMGILRDLTLEKKAALEKKSLESQLFQAQKMESLGVLAGGIAHDFNNILVSILGYADLATQWNEHDPKTVKALGQIVLAGHRARDLVKQILAFSRRDGQEQKACDLGPLIQEVGMLIQSSLPKNITFTPQCPEGKHVVLGNASQLHQVLMNLCTNAMHAMPDGGRLDIRLDTCAFAAGQARPSPILKDIRYHRLEVRDTGTGIAPAILPRIFEPFFTTKGLGGTGLGLSAVHGIIAQHNGAIAVASEPGKGTTFSIYLPCQDLSLERPIAQPPVNLKPGLRILLIDDDPAVLEMSQEMIQTMGYQVDSFCDSIKAMETARKCHAQYQLVLTDLSMPGLDGVQICEELRIVAPKLPVGIFSARITEQDRIRLAAAGAAFMLPKPFTYFEMARELARVETLP